MSKKLNLDDETFEQKLDLPVRDVKDVFPQTALSIVHAGANNYKLVEIRFNIDTGDTSEIKEVCSRHTREEVIEQFKLAVINKGIFG